MRKKKTRKRLSESFGKLKADDFDFEMIEKYFRKKDNTQSLQILSDKTCNDLDFDDLFMFIDRTHSKVGQQYLYNLLRNIPVNSDKQVLREKITDRFTKDVEFRIETQTELEKLDKYDVYHITSLFQDEHIKPPKWYFIIPLLSFTSMMSLIMLFFNPQFILILLSVFIINVGIHYWNKKNLYQYIGSIPQLLRLNSSAESLNKKQLLNEINPKIKKSIKIINRLRNRMSFFRLEAKLESDSEAIFWAMLELFKTLFLIEPLLLFGVLKRLDEKRKEIEDVFCFVGEIDSLMSVASLRFDNENYCLPDISDSKFSMKDIYHPLILDCVPNSIGLTEKSVLLTGSNMSGKTTFIRTIALNVITGLTINTCFAKSVSFPRLKVYSAIRISDDLMNDKSYYFEEVLTIKNMIQMSFNEEPALFLLDEIFKGTNTIERISAGKAVLSALAKGNNRVFVSTHDIELTDMLKNEYDLYHFSEIVKENNVDFDYKLKEGKLKNRNAIRILQINDYPEDVIHEAIHLSNLLDKITVINTKNLKH